MTDGPAGVVEDTGAGGVGPGAAEPEDLPRPQPDPEHSLAPRRPRTVGGAVYLAMLLVVLAGLGVVVAGSWEGGLTLAGGAVLTGAVARLVLPESSAGMLGIRRKLVDVPTLLLLGGGLVLLAVLIPGRAR